MVEELGADAYLYSTLAGCPDDEPVTAQQITGRISSRTPPQRGSSVRLAHRRVPGARVLAEVRGPSLRLSDGAPTQLTDQPVRPSAVSAGAAFGRGQ